MAKTGAVRKNLRLSLRIERSSGDSGADRSFLEQLSARRSDVPRPGWYRARVEPAAIQIR